VPFGAEGSVLA